MGHHHFSFFLVEGRAGTGRDWTLFKPLDRPRVSTSGFSSRRCYLEISGPRNIKTFLNSVYGMPIEKFPTKTIFYIAFSVHSLLLCIIMQFLITIFILSTLVYIFSAPQYTSTITQARKYGNQHEFESCLISLIQLAIHLFIQQIFIESLSWVICCANHGNILVNR